MRLDNTLLWRAELLQWGVIIGVKTRFGTQVSKVEFVCTRIEMSPSYYTGFNMAVPTSVYIFTLPLPCLGVASSLPTGFVAGAIILVIGLLIYAWTPRVNSSSASSSPTTKLHLIIEIISISTFKLRNWCKLVPSVIQVRGRRFLLL